MTIDARAGDAARGAVRLLGIFRPWRLQAYAYMLVAAYALLWLSIYAWGGFPVGPTGRPTLNDFTAAWIAGRQALHGDIASLFDPVQFEKIQAAIGSRLPHESFYPNWPYPPIFFLALAPLAILPYLPAFLVWEATTLLAFAAVGILIVRRRPAIALVLASPFTFWNFYEGQDGFLTAALVGASLLALERRPVLAGIFLGCLAYKPQFGILFPVALLAAKQWRALASAALTFLVLAAVSIALFGVTPWQALPHQLVAHADDYLFRENPMTVHWTVYQTAYGLVRALGGRAALAWLVQGCTTIGLAVVVWLVWRSPARYALKAALLSVAALLATPFAFAYDMAAIAIPIAFLAGDQIGHGLRKSEQATLLALFAAAPMAVIGPRLPGFVPPLGPPMMIVVTGLILRRALRARSAPGAPGPILGTAVPASGADG